jgi:DNA-binding winged helix-turn-helix (wHTH) protein/TolB-like protein
MKGVYEFGEYRFDSEKRVLWLHGEIVSLPPKAAEVLLLLVENKGNLVERREILEKVWTDTFVEEANVNYVISLLRKTLGGDGVIQTIPRRGYRFAAAVNEIQSRAPETILFERRTVSQSTISETVEQTAVPRRTDLSSRVIAFGIAAAILVAGVIGVALWTTLTPAPSANSSAKTIVILPLKPLDPKDEDNEFALGTVEILASRLGALQQLVVRPTSSVRSIAATESDPLMVAAKLGADAVIDMSYQVDTGRIRIVARMLNVSDGSQIWSGNFDEAETDVFKIQDSLSAQIANNLTERLTQQEQQLLFRRTTEDVEAYKLYTRGRYEWNKRTKEGFERSILAYRNAIEIDPSFSLAYAGLADTYVLLGDYFLEAPAAAYPKAKAAALKALELEPSSARARVTLGYILATYDWNYDEAEKQYRASIEIEPNYATAHQWYGEMLGSLHRFPEAELELDRAAELDPLVPVTVSERGFLLYYQRKLDESLALFSALKKEHPQFLASYFVSSWIYKLKGLDDKSFEDELTYWKLQGESEASLKELSDAYSNGGLSGFLTLVAERLEAEVARGGAPSYRIAHTFARIGNKDKTLYWIEKCIESRSSLIIKIASDPNFDFIRDEPRFQAALTAINFPRRSINSATNL